MRVPPVEVILTWPLPNYINPSTRGPAVLVVNVVLSILLVIAVSGRFYARIFIKRWFGLDDWMMIPAFIFSICMVVVVSLATVHFGWDRHIWDVAPWMFQNANIIAFIAKFNFITASTFTRLSLICFYYRLIKDSGVRWFRWILHASIAWTTCVGVVFLCLTIWLCVYVYFDRQLLWDASAANGGRPVQCYWVYPPMEHCHCLNEGKVLVGGGIANCITDALVTLLPMPIIMRLQMPLKERIGICILLSIGVLVTIAGAIRTYYSWKGLIDSYDETWWSYPLWLAAAIEIELAAICACAPAWKTLLGQPLCDLSAKLSSHFFSLRSHKSNPSDLANSRQNGSPVAAIRSLQWFQLKSLHFSDARSVNDSQDDDLDNSGEENAVHRHSTMHHPLRAGRTRLQPSSSPAHAHSRGVYLCGNISHDSGFLEDLSQEKNKSPLKITVEQSFDQISSHNTIPVRKKL